MPLYEYHCSKCDTHHELFMSMEQMRAGGQVCSACNTTLDKRWSVPALFTETRFLARHKGDDGFGSAEGLRRQARAAAESAGISTAGKKFFPSLCRPGNRFDPQAWCGDRGDIARAAAAAGVGASGCGINIPPPQVEEIERPYRVADDIVEEQVQDIIDTDYLGRCDDTARETLRHRVREEITPDNLGTVTENIPCQKL